ncbi:MAG: heparan-alpha-glucosaminide N-acetyltransferase domain-containing protein, partial [Bacteroidota bacterium]|nr:heparan-alpha-glucosaminide N-acetyltransferase domain-containing protein [Bacteroidota bacterium]
MFTTLLHLRTKQAAQPELLQQTSYRIDSIDFLRGLVMIIMALDHTRDFIHKEALLGDPLNFATTTPWLFLTRWITHFCAPVFVFLAGTSVFFQGLRKSKAELCSFLIKRGLWLVVVEVTLISFAITFDVKFSFFFLQVIWAIGISMVLLGLAVWLPFKAILAIGLLIVLGHNALDYYEAGLKESPGLFYSLLHVQNFIPIAENRILGILYPFLPWTGLMFLGYCFGRLFTRYEGAERRKVLAWLGTGLIAAFVLLRALNSYGDPSH